MSTFSLHTEIHFGNGSLEELRAYATDRVLLVTDERGVGPIQPRSPQVLLDYLAIGLSVGVYIGQLGIGEHSRNSKFVILIAAARG